MKKAIVALPILLLMVACWPGEARAEWFYLGGQAGGQYFDLDAISGGAVFDQALEQTTANLREDTNLTEADIPQPEPTHYTAAGSFVWGIYTGVSLGRYVRIGARFTHSWMEVRPEGPGVSDEADVSFDMNLMTILGELQIRIHISIVVPFVGVGLGYAYLDSETEMVQAGSTATSDWGTSCIDIQGTVGLDINIGDHFALGFGAHFSFIGFYYEDPDDPLQSEAAWGFVTDFMGRVAFMI